MLVLTGCMAESPPQPAPTTTGPFTPIVTPGRAEPPPRPSPADWFEVEVDSAVTPDGYPKTFGYRGRTPTMQVLFHNAGKQPVTAPAIKFELEQREQGTSTSVELLSFFTGATGDGWKCDGTKALLTCGTEATVAPGETLPAIAIGLEAADYSNLRTHFTATLNDLLYEAKLFYDTST